jgi:hypothetical protein
VGQSRSVDRVRENPAQSAVPQTPDVAAPFGAYSDVTAVYEYNSSNPANERPIDAGAAAPPTVVAAKTSTDRTPTLGYATLTAAADVVQLPATPIDESAEPALAPIPVEPPAPPAPAEPSAKWEIASAIAPVAGLIPLNLSALESGVRGVLDGVSDLDAVWSDESGGYEDYLWLGAAMLVAGGMMQAARVHRARSIDRRTLGFDSVLARWGEQDVVQPH